MELFDGKTWLFKNFCYYQNTISLYWIMLYSNRYQYSGFLYQCNEVANGIMFLTGLSDSMSFSLSVSKSVWFILVTHVSYTAAQNYDKLCRYFRTQYVHITRIFRSIIFLGVFGLLKLKKAIYWTRASQSGESPHKTKYCII